MRNSRNPIEVALPLQAINGAHRAYYLRRPFQREPDFGVTSVNYNLSDVIARAGQLS